MEKAIKKLTGAEGENSREPGDLEPWIEKSDLNGDGRPEYLVKDWCSPTGNCEFWILQDVKGEVREILSTSLAQVVCVRFTRHRTFRDIEISSHDSAFNSPTAVYRFDGKVYVEAESFTYRWEYDDATGKTRQVEGPKKRVKCQMLFR